MTEPLLDLRASLGLSSSLLTDNIVLTAGTDKHPHTALDMIAKAHRELDTLTTYIVQTMRSQGRTWAEVGSALGLTRQAAHLRYGQVDTAVVAGGNNLTRTRGLARKNASQH